ncbi:MAG: phosphoenolpyruvate--protein phosphotransferase [Bacteroidales bacterium]
MHRLAGVGVSPGMAVGRAVLLKQNPLVVRFPVRAARVEDEVARLERARRLSSEQLREIKAQMSRGASQLEHLFDAQILMLQDPMLLERAIDTVRREQVNAEWALQRTFEDVAAIFKDIEDAYLRERRGDVADVVGRLRMNLGYGRSAGRDVFRDVEQGSILVADELTPSMAAQVDWSKFGGFASDTGSRTYHTAILARSLHLPAVVGLADASARVRPGGLIVIDGTTGELLLDPTEEDIEATRVRSLRWARSQRAYEHYRSMPAITADGVAISIQANVELPDDLLFAREYGAAGIGLYRSEFLLATLSPDELTEDVQFDAYRSMVQRMAPEMVTVRTFDVDEDQLQAWPRGLDLPPGASTARARGPLGLRGTRLCLHHRDMFRTQLRALLRAANFGQLRILFPFVSGLEELRQARSVLDEARRDLERRGETPHEVPIGVMLEIPSAAMTTDLFTREVDFLSIGTNDLIQYSLAVDRTDARVSHLYEPLHPAILRTLRHIVRAAGRRKTPVAVCGEMASDPVLLPLLIGLGLREFSMSPAAMPVAKQVIRHVSAAEMERVARHVLRLATVDEIERYVLSSLGEVTKMGEDGVVPE